MLLLCLYVFFKTLCTMFEYKVLLFWARGLILRLKHYCLLYNYCSNITKRQCHTKTDFRDFANSEDTFPVDTLKSRTVDGRVTACLLKFRTICFRIWPISQTSFVKASSSLLNLGVLLRTTRFIFCKYIQYYLLKIQWTRDISNM